MRSIRNIYSYLYTLVWPEAESIRTYRDPAPDFIHYSTIPLHRIQHVQAFSSDYNVKIRPKWMQLKYVHLNVELRNWAV